MIMEMCHSLMNLNVAYISAEPFDLDFVQDWHNLQMLVELSICLSVGNIQFMLIG